MIDRSAGMPNDSEPISAFEADRNRGIASRHARHLGERRDDPCQALNARQPESPRSRTSMMFPKYRTYGDDAALLIL
jgi:hypothetical protein